MWLADRMVMHTLGRSSGKTDRNDRMELGIEIVFQLLVYVAGYQIARLAFPLISSGRIIVQPFDGEFFHGFYRDDEFGRIKMKAEAAAFLGFLILLAIFIASFFLMLPLFDHLAPARAATGAYR